MCDRDTMLLHDHLNLHEFERLTLPGIVHAMYCKCGRLQTADHGHWIDTTLFGHECVPEETLDAFVRRAYKEIQEKEDAMRRNLIREYEIETGKSVT